MEFQHIQPTQAQGWLSLRSIRCYWGMKPGTTEFLFGTVGAGGQGQLDLSSRPAKATHIVRRQHPKSVGRHSRPGDTVLHQLRHEEQEFKPSLRHMKSIKQKVQFLPYDFNLVNLSFLVQIPNLPDSSGPKAGLELCAQDCPLTHNLTLASYQWAVSRIRRELFCYNHALITADIP